MAPIRFDRARIQDLLTRAAARLEGEWLLIGGGAAAAWFAPTRTTEDLDLIGLGGTQAERFALMELAREIAIPIEAVNSAADFYVQQIDGWRGMLVPLIRGPRAVIYRPNATLFILLKVRRMSAVDLDDCRALLADLGGEPVEVSRIRAHVAELPAADTDVTERRRVLLDHL